MKICFFCDFLRKRKKLFREKMARRKLSSKRAAAVRRRKTPLKMPKIETSREQRQEIWGIFFAVLAILSGLALAGKLGLFGEKMTDALEMLFGVGAFSTPIFLGALAFSFFAARGFSMNFTRFFGIFLILIGGLGATHLFLVSPLETFEKMRDGGGFFGAAGSAIPRYFLGEIGALVVLFGIAAIGILLTFPVSIAAFFGFLGKIFFELFPEKSPEKARERERKLAEKKAEKERLSRLERERKLAEKKRAEMRQKKVEKPEKKVEKPIISAVGKKWEFPTLGLLDDKKMQILSDEKELSRKEKLIQEKLLEFGIGCELGAANTGPTVTQFTLKPHEGVKISKITNLKNDLALALAAPSLRLEAPIAGKDLIGIEIPNEKRATVHLKEILESPEFGRIKSSMRLAFGRDVAGNAIVADLAEMPHLLIAGATGSGKSVGMNTFLMSLLFQNSPEDLKLILIDPKVVELKPYNNIPHLLAPVITDAEKALASLRWAVAEMMRRYGELANKGYRNIAEYNEKESEKMPKIVIVVDELADLMMRQLKKETEAQICRLAQMARAVGMHLIIATQRPSVDVITGLIKANIPTRIAFAVTSSVDSRTILDATGAEDLLGKGDMLFSHSALGKPQRIQGIFVSSAEVIRMTNFLKEKGEPKYDDTVTAAPAGEDGFGGKDFTPSGNGGTKEQAIEVIRATGKASASLLQRKLSIGYAKAARILDELEEEGLIGPANGAKAREIYL